MTKSLPTKADDAITFAIASGQVNAIRHLLSFRTLLAMTTGQEWNIGSDGVLSNTTISAVPETNYGSAKVPPIQIGNTAIFAARYGKRVRDYSYTFESDGFDGNDLTILSHHLLKNRQIKEWKFAQEPDRLVWCVLSDGTLLSMTYMREQNVWGWARHETAGFVESVAVIPSEEERRDIVYFVVRRTINGVERRYIETLSEYIDDPMDEAYFLDCGLSYSGALTDTLSGLWHLEGMDVSVYADGNVLAPVTVENGMVTLPRECTKCSIGLEYEFELQPMATEADTREGSTKGNPKKIHTVHIEVYRTRGLKAAQNKTMQLNEIPPLFTNNIPTNSIEPYTGILEIGVDSVWDDQYVAPYIFDNYPVPAKILSLTPNYAT